MSLQWKVSADAKKPAAASASAAFAPRSQAAEAEAESSEQLKQLQRAYAQCVRWREAADGWAEDGKFEAAVNKW
jgi:hypothetical protein